MWFNLMTFVKHGLAPQEFGMQKKLIPFFSEGVPNYTSKLDEAPGYYKWMGLGIMGLHG